MTLCRLTAGALALAALVSGCGHAPRVVAAMDGRPDRVKLLYQEGGTFGVIRCAVGPEGALANCQDLHVTLHE